MFLTLFQSRSIYFSKLLSNCIRLKSDYVLPHINKQVICSRSIYLFTINKFNPCIINSERCMAGHSKWQNIQHIKAAKDKEKHITCNKYVRLVRYAVRENGPDPKTNNKLRNLLEEARKHNIPKETLENALKQGSNKKAIFGTMEILGPGGCIIIVEYEAANVSEIRHDIKVACKKYSANVMTGEGRWRAIYEQKGIITATKELNGAEIDEGKALDSAIEAEAEEVHKKEDEEGKSFLEFVCAPNDLHKVKKELEKQYEVEENYVAYIPISTIKLNDDDMRLVDSFLDEVGNLSEVVRIYENVQ